MKKNIILSLFASLLVFSCTDEISTAPSLNELTEVKFDLQGGFQDGEVSIKIDDKHYFTAPFRGVQPTAGPQATFTTYISRGKHQIIVRRLIDFRISNLKTDSASIDIGSSEKYWVGLVVWEDSLYVQVQDSAFYYL